MSTLFLVSAEKRQDLYKIVDHISSAMFFQVSLKMLKLRIGRGGGAGVGGFTKIYKKILNQQFPSINL